MRRQVFDPHNIVICAASDVLNLNCRMSALAVAARSSIGLCMCIAGGSWLRPCLCCELNVRNDVSGQVGAELAQSALPPVPRASHVAEC